MKPNADLASIRRDYIQPEFDIKNAKEDPFEQFSDWFDEIAHISPEECNCMTLATASPEGVPHARVVLLKGIEDYKFIFYTNTQSDKGNEIEKNPRVCLNFYWWELSRQVRIDGIAERVSDEQATSYFQSRPRESQIGAWASPQSSPIGSRQVLEERVKQLEEKFKGQDVIPKPKQWGGYAISPMSLEFWQGRPSRLHDRLIYFLDDKQWKVRRLAP